VQDLRWSINANNNYSTKIGESENMFMIVTVEEKGKNFLNFLQTTTVISLYTGIVFVVGSTLGRVLSSQPESLWLIELPEANQIVQICEAVVMARSDENLDQ